jgi:uncharacterized protein YaiE (UPF0345 family)
MGVVDAGEFHFETDAPERMTVVSGELAVKLPGEVRMQALHHRHEIPPAR